VLVFFGVAGRSFLGVAGESFRLGEEGIYRQAAN
jgi:hypothetical protein